MRAGRPPIASGQITASLQALASRHLGAERSYRVDLPASYAANASQQRYQLLLVLDAQQHFAQPC